MQSTLIHSDAEVAAHAAAIAEHGYTVLRGIIPPEPLERLRRRMDRDSEDLLRFVSQFGGNPRARGHLQQGPPPFADYLFSPVAANPEVVRVVRAVLGEQPYLSFYNGNTNYPGSERQHVHLDGGHVTAPGAAAEPTRSVVVNIPPGPCHRGNGAIELWPGSHRLADRYDGNRVSEAQLAARRGVEPPVNAETAVGDVLIRDMRLWHCGVPNESDRARHMIAMVFSAASRPRRKRMTFGRGCETAFVGSGIDPNADFVSGPIDYLYGPSKAMVESRWQR